MIAPSAGIPMTWAPSPFNAKEILPTETHFYRSHNKSSESRVTRILRSVIRTTYENLRFSPFQIYDQTLAEPYYGGISDGK